VHSRLSDQCQGHIGAQQVLCPVSGFEIGLLTFLAQVIRRLSVCTPMPHREGNSMGGPTLFYTRIREGAVKLGTDSNGYHYFHPKCLLSGSNLAK